MVFFFLRLVNIFPSNLLGVSFVLRWLWWQLALFICFWGLSVESPWRGSKSGDKVSVCSCTRVYASLGAGFRGFIAFSEGPRDSAEVLS